MGDTFLTLTNLVCKRLNEEVLTSSNFAAAGGQHATIKDCVNASIREIQQRFQEWPWSKASRNFSTVAGTTEYTPASDVGNIDWDTFYIGRNDGVTPAIVAQGLTKTDFTLWAQNQRPFDLQMTSTGYGKPTRVIRSPANSIILSIPPNTVYVVNYDAWTVPADLSTYDELCVIPSKYNSVIVEGALKRMYNFRSDTVGIQVSAKQFEDGIQYMLRIEIPPATAFTVPMVNQKRYSSWIAPPTYEG